MSNICKDCIRQCGAVREILLKENGRYGFCRAPQNPVIARAALHHWEEPCISGKNGSGTVFFSGCNLRCVYCQNYEISNSVKGKEITVNRLKEIYRELIRQGAHNINLVTPGHYTTAILESLEEPLIVPVVYNTNGYDCTGNIRRLKGKIQIYLPDLKYSDDTLAQRLSHAPGYFAAAKAAILEMFHQTGPYELDEDGMMKKGVIIRHLLLPGNVENTLRVIDFVAENFKPGEVFFSLMRQYTPHGNIKDFPELNRKVTEEEYNEVEEYLFDSGIEDGFLQDEESAAEEYIPPFDNSGV
ncbi:MAG: radical SAM protein [Lentisphaeria bacterium]|nr:radical SAM protein [Lentisphaeria bacterium]